MDGILKQFNSRCLPINVKRERGVSEELFMIFCPAYRIVSRVEVGGVGGRNNQTVQMTLTEIAD